MVYPPAVRPQWPFALIVLSSQVLAAQGLPGFDERARAAGIHFQHLANPTAEKFLIEAMGGGVAVLDTDGDGWLDLFFVNSGAIEEGARGPRIIRESERTWNRLYRNQRDGTFLDVTAESGLSGAGSGVYGMGVATGDYDNDGDTDVLTTGYPRAALYRNNGRGQFSEVTEKAGVSVPGWSVSAGFFDADADGDLDLFVVRYLDWDFERHVVCDEPIRVYCSPQMHEPVASLFFRNGGDGTFIEDSERAGLSGELGKGLGVAFHDAEGDGDLDVLVANDSEPQQLFLNDGTGVFEEDALFAGVGFNEEGGTYAGMGIDWADADNDLDPDVIITNLSKELYAFYANDADGLFEYRTRQTQLARISALSSGWGVRLFDHDLDGWKDLFVAQSHVMDNVNETDSTLRYEQPPLLAVRRGDRYLDVSSQLGPAFQLPIAGRGAAFGDLDNDGDVDVAVSVLNGSPLLLTSQASGSGSNWIEISLEGMKSPRDGQGAVVRIETASGNQQRLASTAGSYLSASDPRIHFGLGEDAIVRVLRVRWPSGIQQELRDVEAGQLVSLTEPSQ